MAFEQLRRRHASTRAKTGALLALWARVVQLSLWVCRLSSCRELSPEKWARAGHFGAAHSHPEGSECSPVRAVGSVARLARIVARCRLSASVRRVVRGGGCGRRHRRLLPSCLFKRF
jgi:hypothetical protein